MFISSVFALFCFSVYMLHGTITSLENENGKGFRGNDVKSAVESSSNDNNASEKNEKPDISGNNGYDIDEGVLIDFHVANGTCVFVFQHQRTHVDHTAHC